MAELPLIQGIPRFKANEDRLDRFMNGTALQTWITSGGTSVPTIRKFLADKDSEINVAADGILASSLAARNAAQSAAIQADASADDAADSASASATARDQAVAAAETLEISDESDAVNGTRNDQPMSALRVAQQVDQRLTKLFGADSKGRSGPARFGDTLNLREIFNVGGLDASIAENEAAWNYLLGTVLPNNPQIKKVVGAGRFDIIRTSAQNRDWPAGVDLLMDGTRFRWSGDLSSGSAQFLNFLGGSKIQGMGVDLVNGSAFRRFITTANAMLLLDNEVISESQINNANGLLDYAFRIMRSDNKVRGLKIKNIHKQLLAYGFDGDGNPGLNNRFDDVEAISYQTGFELRNQLDCRNVGYRCRERASGVLPDPGNNGILHSGVSDYVLANFTIRDAGEHGARFGGTRNAEQASQRITVSNGEIHRSAQSGLKFFNGVAGQRFRRVVVTGINVIDCQYEPERPGDLPGFNDEGFLLQQIDGGTFSGLSVSRQDNPTGFSSDCCVYISGANNLNIHGIRGDSPRRHGVYISQYDGGQSAGSVENLDNTAINITGLNITNTGMHGVYIESPSNQLRDVDITGKVVGAGGSGSYTCYVDAAIARFSQQSKVNLQSRGFSTIGSNLGSSGNWIFNSI